MIGSREWFRSFRYCSTYVSYPECVVPMIIGNAVYENEADVGEAIEKASLDRSKIFVTTKFGGGDIETEFQNSLKKVRLIMCSRTRYLLTHNEAPSQARRLVSYPFPKVHSRHWIGVEET